MPKYEVVLEIEVEASSPTHAATIARDMMLDSDTKLLMDVHRVVWCEAAEVAFPDRDQGWQARFENRDVRLSRMIEWVKHVDTV
jgi:hypothetical protein